jgi:uncharacterized membrane protein YqiK
MIATYIVIAIIVIVLATWEKSPFRIYWKSEAGMAFVRTGLGGAKPVIGRGALVIPLLHKVQWVDLGETRLVVVRREKNAVLSKDHLRVDMEAEFYVRVRADKQSVHQASVTLGKRAQNAESLRDFLEPNLVDSLQAVASEMTLQEMHDHRIQFSKMVRDLLLEDLDRKGLELTNVSLSSFNQTPLEFYDPDNVFDAEGLLAIKELTESRKKERNEIEKEQALLVEQKNLEVRKRSLDLDRDRAFAEQNTRKAIEAQKEESDRELVQLRLTERRQSEEARIAYDQDLKEKELAKERYLDEKRIAKNRSIDLANIRKLQEVDEQRIAAEKDVQTAAISREIELAAEKRKKDEILIELENTIEMLKIEKDRLLEQKGIAKQLETDAARINMERELEGERINKDRWTQLAALGREIELIGEEKKRDLAEMERNRTIELTRRAKEIAVAGEEKAIALALTDLAHAQTQREAAEQQTLEVKVKSQAERQKIAATIHAEEEATLSTIEKETAVSLGVHELVQMAQAKLEAAGMEAKARDTLTGAMHKEAMVNADAERAMVEARNLASEHILKDARYGQLIGELAKIAAELMKPAEKIDSIKIVHVDGFGSVPLIRGAEGDAEESLLTQRGAQSAISTIINGILQIGAFRPVFRQMLGEDGIAELDQDRLVQMVKELAPGLMESAGREVIKTSVRNEQQRKKYLKAKKDDT